MKSNGTTIDETEQERSPAAAFNPSSPRDLDSEIHQPTVAGDTYTAEEEALVEERLKNLGYL